jgi:hypothetical protein
LFSNGLDLSVDQKPICEKPFVKSELNLKTVPTNGKKNSNFILTDISTNQKLDCSQAHGNHFKSFDNLSIDEKVRELYLLQSQQKSIQNWILAQNIVSVIISLIILLIVLLL